ncbi:MAG: serine hydrolase [Ignavibacteriales bacterium]|nr:serine hydrolase [Ignavibacteriales bacterium]
MTQPNHRKKNHRMLVFMLLFAPVELLGQLNNPEALLSARIDSVANDIVIQRQEVPGAVILVAKDDKVIHRKAYGYARLYDQIPNGLKRLANPEPMEPGHMFDLASMTKILGATLSIMTLVDRGEVILDEPLYHYLPEFRGPSKDSITVRHLLSHASGLYQWQPLYLYTSTRDQTFKQICNMPLQYPVGEARHYSDLGFMLLGYIAEKKSGKSLDHFAKENIYMPLGLKSTSYTPLRFGYTKFASTSHGNPYEYKMVDDTTFGYHVIGEPGADIFKGWRKYTLRGETNDGNSFYANEGIAGHAGLFSTVDDITVLLSLMLNKGEYRGKRIFRAETVEEFIQRNNYGAGLGWALTNIAASGGCARRQDSESARGNGEEIIAVGHGGFTGTQGDFIPSQNTICIILTNRQNLGVREDGRYNEIGNLRRGVTAALLEYFKSK